MTESKIRLVRKRDGRLVPFDQEKITNAIFKAAQAVGGDDRERAVFISNSVVKLLEERYGGAAIPSVEDIQDLVERALIKFPHKKLRTSDRRYHAMLRQFWAFKKKYPGRPVTFYSTKHQWL